MPNPGKPIPLKVLTGSRRLRDAKLAVALPALSVAPPPPEWLPNAHAVREWLRLASLLVANGLLTDSGLSALGHLCALLGILARQLAAGSQPSASLVALHRALGNDFGLTPASIGKCTPSGTTAPATNRFAQRGRRPAPPSA